MTAAVSPRSIRVGTGRVVYELLGPESGGAVVLTPGGRFGKDVPGLRRLAETLTAFGLRVLLWDRPGCGSSDIQLWGESESHMRAQVLAELLSDLGLAPCMIAGGSGGARDSMLTALTHPEVASRLVVWNVVGGVFGVMNLAAHYAMPSLNAVRTGGMEAVIALSEWRELIEANPRNEEILRSLGAAEFWRVMRVWLDAFVPRPGATIPGVPDTSFDTLEIPTLIIRGGERDPDHPRRTSWELHSLIRGSRLVEPPWPEDAWERSLAAHVAGRGHMFDAWPLAAPLIAQFAHEG